MLFSLSFAQQRCGTMEYLNQLISENPALKVKIDSLEKVKQVRIKQKYPVIAQSDPATSKNQKKMDGAYPCSRNNTLHQTFAAPTSVGDSVSSGCINAGKYNRITNMVAGYVYEIHTCYGSNFDTQITIYNADDGLVDAYNDDYCGLQSIIYFTPLVSGNYEILVDEYDCVSNTQCASLVVKLFYIPRPVITIPVVVHVVYNTSEENILDAQIYSQINVLNEDFRRLNADIYGAPVAFRGTSTDPLFEFCLAQRDPNGNPTNGITRTYTSINVFDTICTNIKCIWFDILGGKDGWNTAEYLNIWVCDRNLMPLGSAFLPGTSPTPEIDGIVIDYKAFGTIGTAISPYNLGRTTTHEIGHWLDLYHIWGVSADNNPDCDDDFVFDTPTQQVATFNCPPFPFYDGCINGTFGIMFVNYMDYVNDNCMSMFTLGQFIRMDDAIFNPRYSLQNSLGCTAPTTIIEKYPTDNYFVQIFPNPNIGTFTLKMKILKKQDVQLVIINAIGQEIYFDKTTQFIGTYQKQIDLSKYSKGIYLIQIITGEKIINNKIVKE